MRTKAEGAKGGWPLPPKLNGNRERKNENKP